MATRRYLYICCKPSFFSFQSDFTRDVQITRDRKLQVVCENKGLNKGERPY